MLSRREWLRATVTTGAVVLISKRLGAVTSAPIAITVYKSPTCGCCKLWVSHLEKNGFAASVRDLENLDEVKRSVGVPKELESCHTAIIGPYVVEGHVPADLIHKMLDDKATFRGLAAPGMPSGSPGMEGGPKDHYDVVAFERNGKTRVYAKR